MLNHSYESIPVKESNNIIRSRGRCSLVVVAGIEMDVGIGSSRRRDDAGWLL